ncbi:MAG TPA: pyridoxal-phosphate dependent enzyme, partial [Actinomycetes bacterium]
MDELPGEPRIADSLIDLIGDTPLLHLGRVAGDLECRVVAKLEMLNPGGSVKDRPALAMIEAAERSGELGPGGTIIEPTSGNTGVGLAIVAAERGYKCIFVVTDKVAPEKIHLLEAYGARVVVCPVAVDPADPRSYYSVAERLVTETPGAFRPNQYGNPENPRAHELSTGPEIWKQTAGRITHFVAGIGTSGTIMGTGRRLKEHDRRIQVIAVEPDEALHGLEGLKHMASSIV